MNVDVLVVGTGSAASTVATRAAAAGRSVAIVDARPFGGTCALRGCEPKKTLVEVAETVDRAHRFVGRGVEGDVRFDWPAAMRVKRSFTDPVPASRERSFADAGIRTFHGTARFESPAVMRVGDEAIEASRIVLATGARPRTLEIPGEDLVTTSDGFLELDELPREIAFIGGGYVSFEFAHLAARAGASCTILHRSSRPLREFDADLVRALVAATRAAGIRVVLDAPVTRVRRENGRLALDTPAGAHACDLAVHGAGRVPQLDALEIAKGDVARTKRGVKVDAHLRSATNPRVFACGDCADTGAPPLTPVAGAEGEVVAENVLAESPTRTLDTRGVASAVFSMPPLAAVGLTEEAARDAGIDIDVLAGDTAGWATQRRLHAEHARYKILVDRDAGRIVGAHVLGPRAAEVVNLFALAIRIEAPASALKETLFAYPSSGYDVRSML